MPDKTVFISSTYKDLKAHRRAVWDALKQFDVSVRGMEQFGARTTGALDTCLAEVEAADVYVGIIGYRLGTINQESGKPFTVLEYEKAVDQKAEILLYLADDDSAAFSQSMVDQDGKSRERLQAFKNTLRDRHTVDTFSNPEDLAAKLTRDFKKHFAPAAASPNPEEDEFGSTLRLLKRFLLTPKRFNGYGVRLRVAFHGSVFPASRELCRRFNLQYGDTVGARLALVQPKEAMVTDGFREIYAAGTKVDPFVQLVQRKAVDLYAQLQFAEEDVRKTHAEFVGRHYFDDSDVDDGDPREVWVPSEGKVILLFGKEA